MFSKDCFGALLTCPTALNTDQVVPRSNELYGWGWNGFGELGTGDELPHLSPVRIESILPASCAKVGQQSLPHKRPKKCDGVWRLLCLAMREQYTRLTILCELLLIFLYFYILLERFGERREWGKGLSPV